MIYVLCSRCHIDQPRDQFGPNADMWPTRRECKKCKRYVHMVKKHGVDADQKQQIVDAQGGCRICGHPEPSAKGWVVDHDHSCCPGDASCANCRRGVLCHWCNVILGNAFDRPQILRAAADYLERTAGDCSWHHPVACAPSICNGHLLSDAAGNATNKNGQDGTHVDGVKQR